MFQGSIVGVRGKGIDGVDVGLSKSIAILVEGFPDIDSQGWYIIRQDSFGIKSESLAQGFRCFFGVDMIIGNGK